MTTPRPDRVVYSFRFHHIGRSTEGRVLELDYMTADEQRAGFEDRLMADVIRFASRFLASRSFGVELEMDQHTVAVYAGGRTVGSGTWTREQC